MDESIDYSTLLLLGTGTASQAIQPGVLDAVIRSCFDLLSASATLCCRSQLRSGGPRKRPPSGRLNSTRLSAWASVLSESEWFSFEIYDRWSTLAPPSLYASIGLTSSLSTNPDHYVMVAARDSILCDSFSRLRHLGGELVSVIPVAYGFLETGIGWDRPVHKMPGFREYMIDVRFHDVLGLFARAGRRIPDSLPSLYAGNILTTQHLSSPDADLPPTRFSRLEY